MTFYGKVYDKRVIDALFFCAILKFENFYFGRPYSERIYKMTYIITADECIACGACEAECPEGAISEMNGTYVIDAAKCQDCGACADVCPVGAPKKI